MFTRVKVGTRIIGAFAGVLAMVCGIAWYAVHNLRAIDESYQALINRFAVPMGQLVDLTRLYQRQRVVLRDLAMAVASNKTAEQRREIVQTFERESRELDQVMDGRFVPLDNGATIQIMRGEVFVSHVPQGGSLVPQKNDRR